MYSLHGEEYIEEERVASGKRQEARLRYTSLGILSGAERLMATDIRSVQLGSRDWKRAAAGGDFAIENWSLEKLEHNYGEEGESSNVSEVLHGVA